MPTCESEQHIREWFKAHRVLVEEFAPNTELFPWQYPIGRLHWRDPHSQINSITYIIAGPYLMVTGDLGDAIYQWSQVVTFKWLAGLDFGYMQSKCRASPQGLSQTTWDRDTALAKIASMLSEDPQRLKRVLDAIATSDDCLANQHEWHMWLELEGSAERLLGSDLSGLGDVGMRPTVIAMAHWLGLRMAVQQLEDAQR